MRSTVADRHALAAFAAIPRAHLPLIPAQGYLVQRGEDVPGEGDVPDHLRTLAILDEVIVLGVELEEAPARVHLRPLREPTRFPRLKRCGAI